MLIEIKDPTLVERLRKLLPRPDAPFDTVLKSLLEKSSTQLLFVSLLEELKRLQSVVSALQEKIGVLQSELADLKARVAERGAPCGPYVLVPFDLLTPAPPKAELEAKSAPPSKAKLALAKLRASGRTCFTYSEIRVALGYMPSAEFLKKYFRKSEENGLYCLQ